MKKNYIVCYLFTLFDETISFKNFVHNYKKYRSGTDHKLVICFKLLDNSKIENLKKILVDVNFTSFIDPVKINDFDFGSYKRIAKEYPNNQILFLNSHSYPVCDDWLLKLINHSNDYTLIGTSASNESILDSIKLKKKYKILSHIFQKFYFKRKFINFPNPHIRTSSFLLNSKIFLDYISNKKILSKKHTWEIESGKNSITNYFKNKKFDIYVVNSDGKKFVQENWRLSETYNYFKQSKSIISDKHTRKYDSLNKEEKFTSRIRVWGQ